MNDTKKSNISLWESVQKTEESATRPILIGPMKGKVSIDGLYFIKKATEIFGPIGKNWGYDVVEDYMEDTIPIYVHVPEGSEPVPPVMGKNHTARIVLWWKDQESPADIRYEITHYGHTPYIYNSKHGPICDTEARKKSLTDAQKKCLSHLGIGSDVYMGMFEDQEYMQELREEQEIEKADDRAAKEIEIKQEYEKLLDNHIQLIEKAQNTNALEKIFCSFARTVKRKGSDKDMIRLVKAKDKRKYELTEELKK